MIDNLEPKGLGGGGESETQKNTRATYALEGGGGYSEKVASLVTTHHFFFFIMNIDRAKPQ